MNLFVVSEEIPYKYDLMAELYSKLIYIEISTNVKK